MNRKIARAGVLLFAITVISKIAAFVVTIIFSHYFGTDIVTDAYYAAGTIPNLINNSLTICALTLFIPVYTKCRSDKGKDKADEFTSYILNIFVAFNTVLFIMVCICSSVLARLVAPGFADEGLIHISRMICLLSMSFPFTVAVYTLNNLCNINQSYILPAVLILFNHIFIIILTIFLAPLYGIYAYPFICTSAWIIQLIILYLYSRKKLFHHKIQINIHNEYFKYMLILSIPVMLTTAADQINLAADNIISSDLPGGSLSCLGYAHRIFNSINGLVTATLLTIYYPILAKQYANRDKKGLDDSLRKYLDIMLFLTVPLTLLLIGNSDTIINLLFNHGEMKDNDVIRISLLFIIYISGLLFLSLKEITTKLFYIIGDTKKPTIINGFCVVMNIVLSITLKKFLGIYGIAIATTASAIVCAVIEGMMLVKQAGGGRFISTHHIFNLRNCAEIVGACCLATAAMFFIKVKLRLSLPILNLVASGVTYMLIFVFSLTIVRNEYIMKILPKEKR